MQAISQQPIRCRSLSLVTAPSRLDRKARIAIAAAVTLVLAGPVFAMRSCVSSLQARKSVVASGHPSVDGVLRLENGATVFLPNASLSQKVATWLAVETHAKPSFEIPGANFVASGVELT